MKITKSDGSETVGTTEHGLPNDSTTLTAQTDVCELQAIIDVSAMAAGDQFQFRVYDKINGSGSALLLWECILGGAQPSALVTPIFFLYEGWQVTAKKLSGTDRSIGWTLRKKIEGETIVIAADGITSAKIADDAFASEHFADDCFVAGNFHSGVATEFQSGLATGAGQTTIVAGLTAIETDTQDIQSRIPDALSSGNLKAHVKGIDDGLLTAAKFAADCFTAAKFAADVGTEFATSLFAKTVDGAITVEKTLISLVALMLGEATGLNADAEEAEFLRQDGSTTAFQAAKDDAAGTREQATLP